MAHVDFNLGDVVTALDAETPATTRTGVLTQFLNGGNVSIQDGSELFTCIQEGMEKTDLSTLSPTQQANVLRIWGAMETGRPR